MAYQQADSQFGIYSKGGTLSQTKQTVTKYQAITLLSEKPKKSILVLYDANGGDYTPAGVELRQNFIDWSCVVNSVKKNFESGATVYVSQDCYLTANYEPVKIRSLPTAQKKGYTFEGWYLPNGQRVTGNTLISDNCTLTAKWQQEVKETSHVHTPGEWVTTREATKTIPGECVLRCQECGQVMQTETIPILIETGTEGNDDVLTGDTTTDKTVTENSGLNPEDDLIYNPVIKPEEKIFSVGDEITTNRSIFTVTKMGNNPSVEYTRLFDENITDLVIPESIIIYGVTYKVTSIASNAFYKNASIKSVTLNSSVTKIGSKAFYGCTSLKDIVIFSTKLKSTSIGTNAFAKVAKNVKVYVPSAKYKTYKKC